MEDCPMKRCRILVVGGGLAGLALARALDEAGFAPQVIERAAGWQVSGAGMYLQANGVRPCERGVWTRPWPPGPP
jgi:2-polyprenyl-6-methoxyphenol hydroxylase-like FAD-dependent oxidoreductase